MNIAFLKECDNEYYNTEKCLISDAEYDLLKEQLKADKPGDPYFKTVGAPIAGSTVELPHILGSLTKTKSNGSLSKWCTDNKIKLVCLSDKLDGVSIYCRYDKGVLIQASTRGDGYQGKDITEKIRMIQPTIYNNDDVIEIRGEAVMTPENRDKLGYTLARSAVSGILNGDDQEHYDKMKYVDLVFYTPLGVSAEDWTTMFFNLEMLKVSVVPYATMNVTLNIEERLELYFHDRKKSSDWDIDGIVVANYHDTTIGEDYYPENIVAFKVNEKATKCIVTSVEWEVKRSGKIQPVVHFDPVNINGSMVRKATGFNMKFIMDNFIAPGDCIGIVKSGDIIPYITENFSGFDGAPAWAPKVCPSCGKPLSVTESGVDLICTNSECSGQLLYTIEHFLLSHGVEEVTATTLKKMNLGSIYELYTMTEDQMAVLDGIGKSKAKTIKVQLEKTLNTTDEKFLRSLGIPGIGNSASDLLVNTYGGYVGMLDKGSADFITIDGIGRVLAENLSRGLTKSVPLYTFLRDRGLTFETKKSMNLQGKVFTLTGKSDISRNDLVQMIGSHGGMVKGISKKVNYLVTDDTNSTSGKMKKALQYGIEIISYDQLLSIIG